MLTNVIIDMQSVIDRHFTEMDKIEINLDRFGLYDYVVFGLMLALCSAVGLYYGCRSRIKANDSEDDDDDVAEYLVGGRNMSVVPVAISLVAR